MAEHGGLQQNRRMMEVFWTKFDSDIETDEAVVAVPGVSEEGNIRPKRKMTVRRTKEVKPVVPKKPPVVEELARSKVGRRTEQDCKSDVSGEDKENVLQKNSKHNRSASLRDLRPEDKKRVANLIKELAKVGEEKDSAQQQLQGERERYERQMIDLETQKQSIIREREELQRQFLDTQALLLKYQRQVMDQQKQLDDSLTQMLTPSKNTKVTDTEKGEFHGQDPPPVQRVVNMGISHPLAGQTRTPMRTHAVIDNQRYTPREKQHSNYHMFADSAKQYPVAYPGAQGQSQAYPGPESHPYTQFIDQQIAQEKQFSQEVKSKVSRRPQPTGLNFGDMQSSFHANWSAGPGNDQWNDVIDSDIEYVPEKKRDHGRGGSGIGPLHAPVMSSTQRSDAFQMSQRSRTAAGEFEPLIPGSSSTSQMSSSSIYGNDGRGALGQNGLFLDRPGSHVAGMMDRNGQFAGPGTSVHGIPADHSNNLNRPPRVTFAANQMAQSSPIRHVFPAVDSGHLGDPGGQRNKGQLDKVDSPVSTNFHDHLDEKGFIKYYKGLTPEQRKRELLAQKANLIQEQNRLRNILAEQEDQLRQKQKQLHDRQMEQRQRLMHFEKTGQFPGQPPQFLPQSDLNGDVLMEDRYNGVSSLVPGRDEMDLSDTDKNLEFLESHGVDTSPFRASRARSRLEDRFQGSSVVSVGTSPISPAKSVNNATSPQSSSFRKVLSPIQRSVVKAHKQGNLPLHINRQRTSPIKTSTHMAPDSPKTMSMVDIVESIENGGSPRRLGARTVEFEDDVQAAEEEESKVLEEVFFMR